MRASRDDLLTVECIGAKILDVLLDRIGFLAN